MAGIVLCIPLGFGLATGAVAGVTVGMLMPSLKMSLGTSLIVGCATYIYGKKKKITSNDIFNSELLSYIFTVVAGYTATPLIAAGPLLREMVVTACRTMYGDLVYGYNVAANAIFRNW